MFVSVSGSLFFGAVVGGNDVGGMVVDDENVRLREASCSLADLYSIAKTERRIIILMYIMFIYYSYIDANIQLFSFLMSTAWKYAHHYGCPRLTCTDSLYIDAGEQGELQNTVIERS